MTFTDILNILDEAHASFVPLLCHHNADPDAICSAYAFQSLLSKFKPNMTVEIGAGQGTDVADLALSSAFILDALHPDLAGIDRIAQLRRR